MVYGFVKQSGGSVSVYSEPGRGTTFRIYLPRAEAAGAPARERVASAPPARGGGETVLLVEDDPGVSQLAAKILRTAGYEVLTAAGGEEALALEQAHAGTITLLLTDVVMPGMSGRALAERLAERRPQTRVLYMSGYTDNAIVHHGVLDEGTWFLNKPFSAGDLLGKVREVIEGA